jgi:hypothetical protein
MSKVLSHAVAAGRTTKEALPFSAWRFEHTTDLFSTVAQFNMSMR